MPKLYTILQNLNEEDSITQVELFCKYIRKEYLDRDYEERCVADLQHHLNQLITAYSTIHHVRVKDTIKQQYLEIIEKCL